MKGKMMKWLTASMAVIAFASGTSAVRAVSLLPGQSTTSFTGSVSLTGPALADTGWKNFNTGDTKGQVREEVFKDANTGKLDFIYQVHITGGSGGDITRLSTSDWTGYTTSVLQTTAAGDLSGGTVAADSANRSSGAGATVGFNFVTSGGNAYFTSGYSDVLVVQTNASQFHSGNIGLIDSNTVNIPGFSANPEPGSLLLLGSCLAGLGGAGALRRWRKATPVVA
jgi:hypothetical protein